MKREPSAFHVGEDGEVESIPVVFPDDEEEEAPVEVKPPARMKHTKPDWLAMLEKKLLEYDPMHISTRHVQKELKPVRESLAAAGTRWDKAVAEANEARLKIGEAREDLKKAEAEMLAALKKKEAAEMAIILFERAIDGEDASLKYIEDEGNRTFYWLTMYLEEHC